MQWSVVQIAYKLYQEWQTFLDSQILFLVYVAIQQKIERENNKKSFITYKICGIHSRYQI